MHIEIHYEGSRKERDEAAIRNLEDYIGAPHRFELLVNSIRNSREVGELEMIFNACDMFLGVSGLPIHALARRENLSLYRAWMAAGSDPWITDEQGYVVETPEVRQ